MSGSPRSSRERSATGVFRADITPDFAALAFYGAVEQVLTGWIFALLPTGEREYEQAKTHHRRDDLRRARSRGATATRRRES